VGRENSALKKILLECIMVALCGVALGIAANALSPRGLSLSRNYFPPAPAPATATNSQGVLSAREPYLGGTNLPAASGTNALAHRLALRGFRLVDSNYVAQAFNSPERTQHRLIFVDSRDDAHYKQGHIPSAYLLDYFRPESYLPAVLPAAMAAERVIVYCNGGDCEDSEFSATLLKDAGVSADKLHVYGGGFAEWSTNGFPVELGEKDSQQLRQK